MAPPPRPEPHVHQRARSQPQTVNPAQLIAPSGNGAALNSLYSMKCEHTPETSLKAHHSANQSQKTTCGPFQQCSRPDQWMGSPAYPPSYIREQLGYRTEGVNLQPGLRYEPEPLEPLFGLDAHLPELPSPPAWANVRPRPVEEMLKLSCEEVIAMPVEEFMMRYCPDEPPITDQEMIDRLQWTRRGNRNLAEEESPRCELEDVEPGRGVGDRQTRNGVNSVARIEVVA
ncbi:Fc.00g074900.m01.CDS01 [Cosmosporella sp. VM-42]